MGERKERSVCFAVTIKKDRFLRRFLRRRKLSVHKNGRFDPHEPKDIIKSQQAGNGEKAKEGVGSCTDIQPSIDSRTFEALLSGGDDRFFPSHYLTKFVVAVAIHCQSLSQSRSIERPCCSKQGKNCLRGESTGADASLRSASSATDGRPL